MKILTIRNKENYSELKLKDDVTVYLYVGSNFKDVIHKMVSDVSEHGYSFANKNYDDLFWIYNSLDFVNTNKTKRCLNSILKEFSF